MYRIVVVDDEPFIIQLIEKLIDHQRLDVEIVGTATDGSSALELVKECQPDILITDIKMPCLSGLELVEELNRLGISPSIIAVSGYRLFDYAYGAIKSGVEDYLVKPISRKDLNDTLEKVIDRISAQRDKTESFGRLKERVEHGATYLHEQLIADMLDGTSSVYTLDQINHSYLCEFRPGFFAGIAIRIDVPHFEEVFEAISKKCERVIAESLDDSCAEKQFSWIGGYLCGVLNSTGDSVYPLQRCVKRLFNALCVSMDVYEKASVSICVGDVVTSMDKVAASLCDARMCVRVKCICGGNRIYHSSQLNHGNPSKRLNPEQITMLRSLIEVGQAERLQSWLDDVFSYSASWYYEHPLDTLALVDAVTSNFVNLCGMLAISINPQTKTDCERKLACACSLQEMMGCLHAFMYDIVLCDLKQRERRGSFPVQRAKEYIAQNLGGVIRLENIAEHVALSPNYFSALFKKETGQSLSGYIMSQRLEKAKLLLRTTSLNLSQIADQVGYTDAKHFSKLFKKQTGAHPKDYRKMYLH